MPRMPTALPERVTPWLAWPLHRAETTRRIEQAALAGRPPHSLMRRAGEAVARLALAVAPHARHVWVAAGPGNNGGDGLEAAVHLCAAGRSVHITLLADPASLPPDASAAFARATGAGATFGPAPHRVELDDLAIDGLLGIGARRAPEGALRDAISRLNGVAAPVLAIDLPSGLHPDTGALLGDSAVRARDTLALLTIKPGLFTAAGRDHAGAIWRDTLDVAAGSADARLGGRPTLASALHRRRHAAHKGNFGDVLVIGGAPGMAGAAVLAARAALALGAGRVFAVVLDAAHPAMDNAQPELMFRHAGWAAQPAVLAAVTVVCGCGAGEAVRETLPALMHHAARLVLDADALNAIAADAALAALLRARGARGKPTVATPHPLEAARLLGTDAPAVQADRLAACHALAIRLDCCVLLKGSGTVLCAPDAQLIVNPTGNALLSTAGTGDVLAGAVGSLWAQNSGMAALDVAAAAAWLHGAAADAAHHAGDQTPLTASRLIAAMRSSVDEGASA
jgi:ADP-dependent NAD(P)H-hydrate dehydratase / NAD(P)H-hydrate epimerase